MPYVIRPRGVRRAIGALLGAAVLISLLMPAAARAGYSCPTQATTQPFQQFGDSADYFLAPNGGLESGSNGWSLSKASVVTGNEPFFVRSRSDSRSLAISRGGRAMSPWFCVGAEHPTFRFFLRQPQGAGSPDMKVYIRYYTEDRVSRDQLVDTYAGADWRVWQPSRVINLYSNLGFSDPSAITAARMVFEVEHKAGKQPWQVDDLYVDPYRRA